METMAVGRLVIAASPDGEKDWKLLRPEEVPEWLRQPDVLGAMVEGNVAHDDADPANPWYCAVRVPTKVSVDAPEPPEAIPSILIPDRVPAKPALHIVQPVMGPGGVPLPDDNGTWPGGEAA